MIRKYYCSILIPFAIFALLFTAFTRPAQASTPVADPGFAFVDVNGDGLYSASDGDIGLRSTPSVDINALILAHSGFSTGRSLGNYRAPHRSVSLVIPASQSFTLATPLTLQAGNKLIVYGVLQAPTINLTSGGTVDATQSVLTVAANLTITAGSDAVLNGVSVFGSSPGSIIEVEANGSVYALPVGDVSADLAAGGLIDLEAGINIDIATASVFTSDPNSTVSIEANSNVSISAGTVIDAGNYIDIESGCNNGSHSGWGNGNGWNCGSNGNGRNGGGNDCAWNSRNGCGTGSSCGNGGSNRNGCGTGCGYGNGNWCANNSADVVINNSDLVANLVSTESTGGIDIRGADILGTNQVTIAANGNVIGSTNSTDVFAGALQVLGGNGVDLSSSAMVSSGATNMDVESSSGSITLNNADISSSGGLNVHACVSVAASSALINSDYGVVLQADRGGIQINSTTIAPNSTAQTGMSITLQSKGEIDANQATLTSETTVYFLSTQGNVIAAGALIQASATVNSITIFAYGGTVNIVGAQLIGGTLFGPTGVTVIT